MVTIEVKGKEVAIELNWLVLRDFGKHHGIEIVANVMDRFKSKNEKNFGFSMMDDFALLTFLGVKEAARQNKSKVDITQDDVLLAITSDMAVMEKITSSLGDALPGGKKVEPTKKGK